VSTRAEVAPNPLTLARRGDVPVLGALALRVPRPAPGPLGAWIVALASREPEGVAVTLATAPALFALMFSMTSR
jgi:hypothetical protein